MAQRQPVRGRQLTVLPLLLLVVLLRTVLLAGVAVALRQQYLDVGDTPMGHPWLSGLVVPSLPPCFLQVNLLRVV